MTAGSRHTCLLAALFVVSLPLVNPYVRGDGNGYYAYVRSIVIDGDLDFENEFRRADAPFREVYFDEQGRVRPSMRAPTGTLINQWAVGPSMLWLPFFLAAHGAVAVLNLLSADIPADGFSAPYRWFCAVGTAVYGWLALVLLRGPASRLASERGALLAVVGIWWASSLPVYMYFLPFHVHALAAFSVSLFLWYWLRVRPFGFDTRRWAVWGLTAGLMFDVYHLNAIAALPAAAELLARPAEGARENAAERLKAAAAFGAAALAGTVPHFVIKWIAHGSPLITGYQDQFFWTTPRWWQVAFSPEHGLFTWTPVLIVALAGLSGVWRREARAGGALIAVVAVFYYTVASYQNWHGQSSFGSRFFVSLTAVFVLGAASAFAHLERARPKALPIAAAVLAVLIAWNVGFMYQWGANLVPSRGPVDLADVARNQATVVPRRIAGFAWRYLRDRAGLTSEVEQQDELERRSYEPKR
jgi:hypothetical protein